jgi:hypothetical protein
VLGSPSSGGKQSTATPFSERFDQDAKTKTVSFPFSQHVVVAPDVMFRVVGDESVLLNLKTEFYLGLDEMGTRVWAALTGSPSVQDAYRTLLDEYEVDADQLRRDLDDLIGKLLENHLIELRPGPVAAQEQSP